MLHLGLIGSLELAREAQVVFAALDTASGGRSSGLFHEAWAHWPSSEPVTLWWPGQQGTGQQRSAATLVLNGSRRGD